MTRRWVGTLAAALLAACSSPTADPPVATPEPTTSPTPPRATTPGRASPTPEPTPTASPTPTDRPFTSEVHEVADHPVADRVVGVSWREGCPVPLEQLRYLRLSHVTPDGSVQTGELVVRDRVVEDVLAAMRRLYEIGFPIERMALVDEFGADDDASMRANNTSAFNCRYVAGTTRWSNHAYGEAVDINPLWNPYVRGDRVDPPEGAPWADRDDHRPGMLHAGSAAVRAWTDLGWDWGGNWTSGQDYQHVSATGG